MYDDNDIESLRMAFAWSDALKPHGKVFSFPALCVVRINSMSRDSNKNKHLRAFFLGKCFPKCDISCVHVYANAMGCLAIQFLFCVNAH